MRLLSRLHAKFGDFWWWSLGLLIALNNEDIIFSTRDRVKNGIIHG